jgi:heptosyltransferase II
VTPYHTTRRLVILAPNWLGDTVMALPAIADLRRGLPASTIAIAARAPIAPLFDLVDGVDEVLTIPSHWRDAAAVLHDGRFDAVVLLPNSLHAAIVAKRSGIAERWGYGADLRSALLTRALPRERGLHQVAYYQRLVRLLGFDNGSDEPRVSVASSVRDAARTLLAARGRHAGAALVAVAPGAAFGGAKRWPPESFASLVGTLAEDRVQTVVVGVAADRSSADAVLAGVSPAIRDALPPIDLVGATDLSMLAAVLSETRTLVSNDSGAMHVAAAVGTPVTAVFGPTNERETRPAGTRHSVVVSDAWCRPCMLRECPLDHQCMRTVTPSAVLAAARRSL